MQKRNAVKHAFTNSAQHIGLSAHTIRVEADISSGIHSFTIIGLPDKAIEEARDRVSTAIKHTGFVPPRKQNQKIVISLAPGDLKKTGTLFDVPIAIAYLLANKDIEGEQNDRLFVGELSLDGSITKVKGVISLILHAKKEGFKEICIPAANSEEASLIEGIDIIPCSTLQECIDHITEKQKISPLKKKKVTYKNDGTTIFLEHIKGQYETKRALTIAAAGGHNIGLYGPPGTGKTLLARSLQTLLPPLSEQEALEVAAIHSIAGVLKEKEIGHPPFRAPHHSASYTAIIGGGNPIRPGEISLAHKGVLFLDEFPEFDRRVIESLREPLEEHTVTISRTQGTLTFPASCMLVIACNLCPSGDLGSDAAFVSPSARMAYRRKLTGPIVDRIDIWVPVEATSFEELEKITAPEAQKETEEARESIRQARELQAERFSSLPITLNSEITAGDIDDYTKLTLKAKEMLRLSAEKLNLSPRGFHRTMKRARTIADMSGAAVVEESHILEAVRYRFPPEL